MKFTILASLFSLATAFPAKAGQPLDVQLKKTGNTEIKAVVTNKSPKDVRVLKAGSIFDKVHTEKVKITNSNGSAIPFKGFRVSVATENLPEDAFQHIAAGESVEVTFDVAHTHDLSEGGDFNIISEGILQYAHDTKQDQLAGSMAFASNNLLRASVDGKAAAASHEASLVQKRTTLQSDCTGDRAGLQAQASKNCAAMAKAAYDAALSGPAAKMQTYFHDDSQATRKTVSEVYRKAYDECRLTPGGKSLTYCTDVDGVCTPGILALTYFVEHRQIYCDFHYQTELLGGCRAQDQSSTVLHETTHLDYVGFTHDHGYGWDAATSLSTELALDSADTYRFYAKDIYGKC